MPLKVVLHSADQIRLASHADILHIDATAGVLRKTLHTGKTPYIFSIVPESKEGCRKAITVSDFLTERCRVQDIVYWLTAFRCGLNQLTNERIDASKPRIIVTDMSWAILHASILIFGGCFLEPYLHSTYDALLKGYPIPSKTIIFVCSSHVIARLSKTLPGFDKPKEKRFFLACFGKPLMATTLEDAAVIWKRMNIIFRSRSSSENVSAAVSFFTADNTEVRTMESDEVVTPEFEPCIEEESLRRASPFRRFFERQQQDQEEDCGSMPNPHFIPLPLWTIC